MDRKSHSLRNAFLIIVSLLAIWPGRSDISLAEGPAPAASSNKTASTPQETEPLPDGVVLHLSFDMSTMCMKEGKVYAKDLSGKGNGGTFRRVAPAKGKFGTAVEFKGNSGSKISGSDAALPAGSSPSTLSIWFNIRSKNFQFLCAYGTPNPSEARGLAILNPPGLCFYRWADDACDVENTPFNKNEWHHYAVTYDGDEAVFYLDGKKRGTDNAEFKTVLSQYLVGKSYESRGSFDGLLDEFIVFNRVLSESEIQSLWKRKEYAEDAKLSYDQLPPFE